MMNWENEKENLRRMYIEEGLSQSEISRKYDLDQSAISFRLKAFGISRTPEDELRLRIKKNPDIIKICKCCGKEFYAINSLNKYEKDRKYCSPECSRKDRSSVKDFDILLNKLEENNWNYTAVGRLYGVSGNSIKKKVKRLGLYKKKIIRLVKCYRY